MCKLADRNLQAECHIKYTRMLYQETPNTDSLCSADIITRGHTGIIGLIEIVPAGDTLVSSCSPAHYLIITLITAYHTS